MLDLNNTNNKIILGDNIRKARNKKGLTQEKLAEDLAVDRSTLACWECGKNTPDYKNLYKLCNVLDVDVGYLMGDYTEKNYSNHEVAEITGLTEDAIEKLRLLKEFTPIEGYSNILSHLITHDSFGAFLLLLGRGDEGVKLSDQNEYNVKDLVTVGGHTFLFNKKDIANSALKDKIIEMATDIRKNYTHDREKEMCYKLIYGLHGEGRLTDEQFNEIKEQFDNGNYDFVQKGMKESESSSNSTYDNCYDNYQKNMCYRLIDFMHGVGRLTDERFNEIKEQVDNGNYDFVQKGYRK